MVDLRSSEPSDYFPDFPIRKVWRRVLLREQIFDFCLIKLKIFETRAPVSIRQSSLLKPRDAKCPGKSSRHKVSSPVVVQGFLSQNEL